MSSLKERVLGMVADDLADIEIALKRNLRPQLDLVEQVAGHILFAGGKRLRPLLMVLSARLCGHTGDDVKTFATIMEYLHAATLLHDDFVDEAAMRRGKQAAHGVWGPSVAVLVGDFLLARALSMAADAGRPEIIKIMADITENMSQGEIHQLVGKGNLALTQDEYMEVIRRKTAVLIQGGCRVGAIFGNASEKRQEALSDYGLNLGLAFQIADDLLDYTADTAVIGKVVGADLREGKLTLPLIYTLKNAGPEDAERIRELVGRHDFSAADFNRLVGVMEQTGGIGYARQTAAAHVGRAKDALAVFRPSKTREILLDIADFAVSRST